MYNNYINVVWIKARGNMYYNKHYSHFINLIWKPVNRKIQFYYFRVYYGVSTCTTASKWNFKSSYFFIHTYAYVHCVWPFLFYFLLIFCLFFSYKKCFRDERISKRIYFFFFTKKQITLIVWAKRDRPEFARAIIFVIETQIARRAIVV